MRYLITISIMLHYCLGLSAQSWDLDHFLQKVEKQNLEIQAAQLKLKSSLSVSEGFAFPSPKFSLIQQRTADKTVYGKEFMLKIPFPGKIASEHQLRNNENENSKIEFEKIKNNILSNAQILYLEYAISKKQYKLLQKRIQILKDHIQLVRSGVRSDSLAKLHLLEAESNTQELIKEQLKLDENIVQIESSLRSLLQLSTDFVLPNFELPPIQNLQDINKSLSFQVDLDRIYLKNKEQNLSLAKKNWLPDFELTWMEMPMLQNGEKMTQVNLSLSLEFLNFKERYSLQKSQDYEKQRAQVLLRKSNNDSLLKQDELKQKALRIKQQIDVLEKNIIPLAEEKIKLIKNIAPRDIQSIQLHRNAHEILPIYQMEALSLRLNYEKLIWQYQSQFYQGNKNETL